MIGLFIKHNFIRNLAEKNIDAAWKELANKNYIIGFNCYVNGKKQSFYNVSDIPFKSEEFVEFIQGTITELIYSGYSVKSLSPMNGGSLDIDRDLTDVLNVHQFETFNTESSVPTVQY